MKTFALIILLLLFKLLASAQNELINIHSTYYAMHGGMATSGVSTSITYTFVANEKIIMSYTQTNNIALTLQKGDTLIVHLNSYRPYQNNYLGEEYYNDNTIKILENYSADKVGKHTYMLSYSLNLEIDKAITYRYNGKEFVAKLKPEFDERQEHYAP